ncbi:hypothetical protein RUND412_000181 [Rhizina undulata]
MSAPRITSIALIGKTNSPLHISTFPSVQNPLHYHFLAHTALDIFASRMPAKTNGDSDFGLLYAINERLAAYGWLTNTGVKIVVVVDVGDGEGEVGMREGDLKPVFRALQTAYIKLVCNPFYDNDEPNTITSKKFIAEVKRIGESWRPGVPL